MQLSAPTKLASWEGDLTYIEVVRDVLNEPVTEGVVDTRATREGGEGVTGPAFIAGLEL